MFGIIVVALIGVVIFFVSRFISKLDEGITDLEFDQLVEAVGEIVGKRRLPKDEKGVELTTQDFTLLHLDEFFESGNLRESVEKYL